jgi:RNA polymerase sigma-70 factor, ECF subfamily
MSLHEKSIKRPFDEVARDHADKLYRIGLGFCGSHADAQDLAQETLLRAFRKWHTFDGRADPGSWMYRIASRVCLRMRRRRAGQPSHLESLDAYPAFNEAIMTDPDALQHRSDEQYEAGLERLREGIAALPPAFRLPLVMKDIAGLSIEETAEVLGIKPATVKTRLHRARMMLRTRVAKALPGRPGQDAAYSRRVCMDLLEAKLDALDRGINFPVPGGLFCERCRSVFAALDATRDLCVRLAGDVDPAIIRDIIARVDQKNKK